MLDAKEIQTYWERFGPGLDDEPEPQRHFRIESYEGPCKVGFDVGKEKGCPLCSKDKPHEAIEEFMEVAERVMKFRLSEKDDV